MREIDVHTYPVCVCTYVYIYTYVYTYTYIHVCLSVCVHVHMYDITASWLLDVDFWKLSEMSWRPSQWAQLQAEAVTWQEDKPWLVA